jgi:hypothetical protein
MSERNGAGGQGCSRSVFFRGYRGIYPPVRRFYLFGLDHFVKEYLRIEGYVRHMYDLVLFADEKEKYS